uniref:Uncharacterized protein n=1 Tax=Rhizophora mucronata TaxID=61149 RepID=A0A2P2QWW0_RHIMU
MQMYSHLLHCRQIIFLRCKLM